MCGITGYFDIRGQQRTDLTTLMAMTEQLRHRGPDAVGHIQLDNVGFGFPSTRDRGSGGRYPASKQRR